MKKAVVIYTFLMCSLHSIAQDIVVRKNQPFPAEQTGLSSELNEEHVILYFFSSTCTVCFLSLPEINELQRQYKGRVKFQLIGREDGKIQRIYEKYQVKLGLELAIKYDSVVFRLMGISTVPAIVWIDHGIVRTVGGKPELTSENLNLFIAGKPIKKRPEIKPGDFDRNILLGVDGNGGDLGEIRFRSLLVEADETAPRFQPTFLSNTIIDGKIQLAGTSLGNLYTYAYFDFANLSYESSLHGKVYPRPVLELEDTSKFIYPGHLFSYSLILPTPFNKWPDLQQRMKEDLYYYTGYDAFVVTREMPCWKLEASPEARVALKTKGGKVKHSSDHARLIIANRPLKSLLSHLHSLFNQGPPLIDATGITDNIDIEFTALQHNFNDVRIELAKQGLTFVPSTIPMQVLVISNRKVSHTR